MNRRQRDFRLKVNKDTMLLALTLLYFFYGFFEPYLNQIIGPLMRYYIIVLVGLYILRYNGKLRLERVLLYFFVWFLFSCVTLAWARDYEIVKLHFFTVFASILLLICLTQSPVDKRLVPGMMYTFWLGSFLTGFLSLLFNSAYHFQLRFSARQVLTLWGVQTDPNNQAIFLMYGISVSLYFLIVKKEKLLVCIVTIIVNMISMMMTASRGGFLSFGVMLVLIVLVVIKDWKTKIWAVLVATVVVFLVYRYMPSFVNSISFERLTELETYEGGGNRIAIWKNALKLLNENPLYYLFGAGWGSYYDYNGWKGIHNTYLEIFCNSGLIGFLLFFYPVFDASVYLWKKEKYLPIFIALSVFLPSFFIDSINKRFFWNAMFFLFVNYCSEKTAVFSGNIGQKDETAPHVAV